MDPVCQHCGSALTSEAPGGLCPGCLLRTALSAAPRDPIPSLPQLRYFGDYELLEEIARGGMGVVYKARQMSLDRVVALKMMRPGLLATAEEVRRFRAEAAAAAGLQHPNIVAIYEVGEQDGLHYFSMEYVEGASLAQVLGGRPLPQTQAAEIVGMVAEAIEYAHRQGTLHRDLKPYNILIDAGGRPRVTDFGLARPMAVEAGLTASGIAAGTPAYMPPEQAAGKEEALTPAADVYSLGAVLYELLTGRAPFRGDTPLETVQNVIAGAAARPSEIEPRVSRDLETICLKCMAPQPRARYASAQALADDLGRFLRHEPIAARRIGPAARAWRWCRRNPWQTIAAAALAVAAITLAVSASRLREQYFHSLLEQARLERVTGSLTQAAETVRRAAAIRDDAGVRQEAIELAMEPGARLLLDIPFGFATGGVRFTADGSKVAVAGSGWIGEPRSTSRGRIVKVWDVASGRLLPDAEAAGLDWRRPADATEAAAAMALDPGTRLASDPKYEPAAQSADGRFLAALVAHGSQGELAIWNLRTGRRLALLPDNHEPVWSGTGLLATVGGQRIATRGGSMGVSGTTGGVSVGSSRVRVWRVSDPAPSYVVGTSVHSITVLADGQLTVNNDLWQLRGTELAKLGGGAESNPHRERVTSADGKRAMTAILSWESNRPRRLFELWDAASGARIAALNADDLDWGDGPLGFSPDGRLAVAGGPHWRRAVALWDAENGKLVRRISTPFIVRAMAFLNGGRQIAVAGDGVAVMDVASGSLRRKWTAGGVEFQSWAAAGAGGTLATGGEDQMIHLWDAASGREIARWKAHDANVTALAFAASGKLLTSGAEDGSLRVWNLETMRAETARLGVRW